MVVFLPPFAEELNRCRKQMAETARRLASLGRSVLIPDLYGTGDSEGEFEDATWDRWVENVRDVLAWLPPKARLNASLIAVRMGCSLALSVLDGASDCNRKLVFWQPVLDGGDCLKQFLRVRVASGMFDGASETIQELEERLRGGEALDVGGYRLSPSLFQGIESLKFDSNEVDRIACQRELNTLILHRGDNSGSGIAIGSGVGSLHRVSGDAFWRSNEVTVNPDFADLTVKVLAT